MGGDILLHSSLSDLSAFNRYHSSLDAGGQDKVGPVITDNHSMTEVSGSAKMPPRRLDILIGWIFLCVGNGELSS